MHTAIFAQLKNLTPIPGADRIVQATVHDGTVALANVIVSRNYQEGEVGVYFAAGLQLSVDFCAANDLVAQFDEQGKRIGGGYLSNQRKITAQRMRGVRSEGLWLPVDCLDYLGTSQELFMLGDTFTTVNGQEICKRYYSPQALRALARFEAQQARQAEINEKETIFFPEHVDTAQLIYVVGSIPRGALITLTEKLHGTSHRVGNTRVQRKIEVPLGRVQQFVNRISQRVLKRDVFSKPAPITDVSYEVVHGTRHVILEDETIGYYGSNDFRYTPFEGIEIPEGIILYGELVGYVQGEQLIMPPHDTKSFPDLEKIYGKQIRYTYGCEPGTRRFHVYRATKDSVDLKHDEVVSLCWRLGLHSVPYLEKFIYDGNPERLLAHVKSLAEGDRGWQQSELDHNISEGIVVRVDNNDRTDFYKYKSFAFRVMEGITQLPDPEEVQ